MDITGRQITAARALLGWTMKDLADRSGVSLTSVQRYENNIGDSRTEVKEAICETLEKAGVEFSNGGVLPRTSLFLFFEGADCSLRILDDVYYTLKDTGGEVLFSCIDDRKSPESVIDGYRRIRKAGIRIRSLIEEGNTFLLGDPEEYRCIPKEYFHNNPQVIYGNKIATMVYDLQKRALVVENAHMVAAQRNLFNYVWEKSKKPRRSDAPMHFE